MRLAKTRLYSVIKQTYSTHLLLLTRWQARIKTLNSWSFCIYRSWTQNIKSLSCTWIKCLCQFLKEYGKLETKAVTKVSKPHFTIFKHNLLLAEALLRRNWGGTADTHKCHHRKHVKFIVHESTTRFQSEIKTLVTTWLTKLTVWASLVKLLSWWECWCGRLSRH